MYGVSLAPSPAGRCQFASPCYFYSKCLAMIPDKYLKISFEELALRGKKIIAQMPETSYAQALEQVQRLKEMSKVNQSSKKSRPDH